MVTGSFTVGERFHLHGSLHRVFRRLDDGSLAIEELSSGKVKEYALRELLGFWTAGDLVFGSAAREKQPSALCQAIAQAHEDAFRQSYTEAEQQSARCKLVYVRRLESLPQSKLLVPHINEIWSDKQLWKGEPFPVGGAPHYTTVARWVRSYKQSGCDIRVLVDRDRSKGNKDARLDPIIRETIGDCIETRYLTPERPTLKSVYNEILGKIARLNIARIASERLLKPSFNALRRAVHALDAYDVYRARYGKRAADIKFRTAGRGALAVRPLARAAMDHCKLDLFVVDERTGLPLGRPWLTMILDECTRYALGYYIGFEEPSSVSMTRALRHAIMPKKQSEYLTSQWDAWGLMETLVVDNGNEFHGRTLEMGAGRYGITVQFCPRRKPWFKGKIERFFGTLNSGLLSDIQGKAFSSIALRGDYDPSKHAVVRLSTLRKLIHKWIVDVYHQTDHRTLKMTPAQSWATGIADVDRYLPPASVELDAAFSASSKRRLTHKGIELDSLFYNSDELGALRHLHGAEINVEVRTMSEDLGSIIVVAPDGKTLIRVPAVMPEYANGLTRWQHTVCKRYQRTLQIDEGRTISLLEAREQIRSWIDLDMQLVKRQSRNRQQRFVNQGEPGSEPSHGTGEDKPKSQDVHTGQTTSARPEDIDLPRPPDTNVSQEAWAEDAVNDSVPVFSSHKLAKEGP